MKYVRAVCPTDASNLLFILPLSNLPPYGASWFERRQGQHVIARLDTIRVWFDTLNLKHLEFHNLGLFGIEHGVPGFCRRLCRTALYPSLVVVDT